MAETDNPGEMELNVDIDFLTVGNVTHDITPEGFRLGGTVSFAAVTARRLGWRPGVLTRASLDGFVPAEPGADGLVRTTGLPGTHLAGIPVVVQPSPVATTFKNIYTAEGRTQYITAVADPVTPDGLPREWGGVPVVLLGSIARELPPHWATVFPNALIGIAPQGLMRRWDERGLVTHGHWDDGSVFMRRCDAIFLSREDVSGDDAYIAELAGQVRLLVVTDGYHGATVYQKGLATAIPPRHAKEVDPTGAGDVFATSFLVRYAETRDPFLAGRFANIVASMSVEAAGMDAIPERAEVERWVEAESLAGKA